MNSESQLERLIRINTDDILGAIGLRYLQRGQHLLALLCRPAAKRFALQVLDYDRCVAEAGLQVASVKMLLILHNRLTMNGVENIPNDGPVCFLSNHPGLTDTLALFAAIPRADLRILAADRPFLRELPHTSQQLIYLDEQKSQNLDAVRQSIRHLRRSGALLTFPAGKIEPDPALLPGALESLQSWSESVTLFAHTVPETSFVPVLVSGVLNHQAQRSPIRYLRRSPKDRDWLAAMLQILIPAYQPVNVHVDFGRAIRVTLPKSRSVQLLAEVRSQMQELIMLRGKSE